MSSYIVALTGASGAVYGLRLIEELLKRGDDVDMLISPCGFYIIKEETGLDLDTKDPAKALLGHMRGKAGKKGRLRFHPSDDFSAPVASGSSLRRAMIVCPCSMGTLARIATGVSLSLIERAADCVLKERGRLVLVPRETPLNEIHLENMLRLARMGAVIAPAMPAFYTRPEGINDMVDFVAGKVLDVLGVENSLYKRWKG